jgi:orotate phosphoribosyltransferase-like protein
MPARKPDKPKITDELRQELIKRVVELRIEGRSNKFIADKLEISWNTVDSYWRIHLKNNSQIDLDELLLDRQCVTERLVAKAVRDHYEGKVPIKDVETAMNLADRYNGLALKIMSSVNEKLPDLLSIEVMNVPFELPPRERQVEQLIDTVE